MNSFIKIKRYGVWVKVITLAILVPFLCQNIAWASNNSFPLERTLAAQSLFAYFQKKGPKDITPKEVLHIWNRLSDIQSIIEDNQDKELPDLQRIIIQKECAVETDKTLLDIQNCLLQERRDGRNRVYCLDVKLIGPEGELVYRRIYLFKRGAKLSIRFCKEAGVGDKKNRIGLARRRGFWIGISPPLPEELRKRNSGKVKAYLEEARKKVRDLVEGETILKQRVHVVIGTEACDLDSIVASITYAYARQQEDSDNVLVVPVMNIPRDDFYLRLEGAYLLDLLGINEDALIFKDDLESLLKKGVDIDFILVDHNKMTPHLSNLKDRVKEIIDHHKDEEDYPSDAQVEIETVGSTCTMVARRILETKLLKMSPELALLLLCTILLDTLNLNPEKGSTTDRDEEMVHRLLGEVDISQDDIFESIRTAQRSIAGLNRSELLRKDFKEYRIESISCGYSTIFPITLKRFAEWEEEGLLRDLEDFRKLKDLDVLFVMPVNDEGDKVERGLMIYTKDTGLMGPLIDFLKEDRGREIPVQLEDVTNVLSVPDNPYLRGFSISNKASRKKLKPLLDGFFKKEMGFVIPEAPSGYGGGVAKNARIIKESGVAKLESYRGIDIVEIDDKDIRGFIDFYKPIIKELGWVGINNKHFLMFVINENKKEIEGFVRDCKKFNQNISIHISRLLKKISSAPDCPLSDDEKRNLRTSQKAIARTILNLVNGYIEEDVFELFFENTIKEYISEIFGTVTSPPEFSENTILKDYIKGYAMAYKKEMDLIYEMIRDDSAMKSGEGVVDYHIYDIGAWAGLFGPLLWEKLSRENVKNIRLILYIVDPDLSSFNLLGRWYYDELVKKSINRDVKFEYFTHESIDDKTLDNGFAEKVDYRLGAVVVANDFYEHISEKTQREILSRLGRKGVRLHLVHVPYEPEPAEEWGHVYSFNRDRLLGLVKLMNSVILRYGGDIEEDVSGGGLLVVKEFLIDGIVKIIRKIDIGINHGVDKPDLTDTLLANNKFIRFDVDELRKPENSYIVRWLQEVLRRKKREFICVLWN